jgi:hypothetical protein
MAEKKSRLPPNGITLARWSCITCLVGSEINEIGPVLSFLNNPPTLYIVGPSCGRQLRRESVATQQYGNTSPSK